MLKVQALGALRVTLDDVPLPFPTRKAEELLCFLLLHRGRALGRSTVAEALWPMRPPGKALRNLSTALWRLRQTLDSAGSGASSCLRAERGALLFVTSPDYRFDAIEFEENAVFGLDGPLPCDPARQEKLERSLVLYEGDLLSGWYNDWCLSERERLKLLFVRVLKRLMFHSRLCEAYDEAIEKGYRLLALDPLQEDVHRELMRCYAQSGRRAQALEQFEACRRVLREELQIAPMPETCQLHTRIRNNRVSPSLLEPPADSPLSLRQALIRFAQALRTLEGAWVSLQESAAGFPDAEPGQ
jgi:DNA-binding SARP family transcriptional activator